MTKVFNKLKDDRGALIVEASLSLPFFIFTIFIMLSIINICYVQAKVGSALASASKEISQYSYVYYMLNGDGAQQAIDNKGEDFNEMLDNVNVIAGNGLGENGSGSFEGTIDELSGQLEHYAGNPADLLVGAFAGKINENIDRALNEAGGALTKAFMKKNLVESGGGDADRFLKNLHVVGGLAGLTCGAEFSLRGQGGSKGEIAITVKYQVQVVKLLGLDFKFDFSQTAKTKAWGLGGPSAYGGSS